MGRPKKVDALTEVLKVRLTPEMVEQVDEARGDLSRADWVRLVLQANTTRTQPGGDLSEVPRLTLRPVLPPEVEVHRHRRGKQRTKALGNMKASYWCATPGCTEILHGG